jgi:hypothetical protein
MTSDPEPTLRSEYNSEYKFTHYVGKPPSYLGQQAPVEIDPSEANGDLVLGLKAWVFHFGEQRGAVPCSFGGYDDHEFEVTEASSNSCHAVIRDRSGNTVAVVDVLTSADILRDDLSQRDGIVPPEVADRIAREAEAVKAKLGAWHAELRAKDEVLLPLAAQLVATRKNPDVQSTSQDWWLKPNAFGGLGRSGMFSAKETHYLGGWPGHTKTYTGKLTKLLVVDKNGVSLRGLSTIFTIPWQEITDLDVDGAENASKRVTAGRVAVIGVFALVAKKHVKDSMLIVTTASGDQALFHSSQFTALELRQKLLPLITQIQKSKAGLPTSSPAAPPATGPTGSSPIGVADELTKLSQLRDSGVLSDEEFATQKAKLLG